MVDNAKIAPVEFTSSAYLMHCNRLAAKFARRLGRGEGAMLDARAERMRAALNARYNNGGGSFAHDEMTALGMALVFDIAPEGERAAAAERLARIVRDNGYKPYFGILGSRAVPRALADAGFVETAFRLFMQPEYPGWIHWLRQGATTLWGQLARRGVAEPHHVRRRERLVLPLPRAAWCRTRRTRDFRR